MDFGLHPSKKLQKLFTEKPYQIQEPEKSKIIFLGRDANWDINIEKDPLFPEFEEYLKNGISYWQTHGYHTPMLSPNYKGDGKTYHRNFKKIGFTSDNAEAICFLELLKFPTYGMSSKYQKEYIRMVLDENNKDHLNRIKKLQQNGKVNFFIPDGLRKYIYELQLFPSNANNVIYHTHFSNAISNEEITRIRQYCISVLKN